MPSPTGECAHAFNYVSIIIWFNVGNSLTYLGYNVVLLPYLKKKWYKAADAIESNKKLTTVSSWQMKRQHILEEVMAERDAQFRSGRTTCELHLRATE